MHQSRWLVLGVTRSLHGFESNDEFNSNQVGCHTIRRAFNFEMYGWTTPLTHYIYIHITEDTCIRQIKMVPLNRLSNVR